MNTTTTILTGLILTLAGLAGADVLVWESFDYPTKADGSQLIDGTNWTDGLQGTAYEYDTTGLNSPLIYSEAGGAAHIAPDTRTKRYVNLAAANFSGSASNTDAVTDYWIAMLLKTNGIDDSTRNRLEIRFSPDGDDYQARYGTYRPGTTGQNGPYAGIEVNTTKTVDWDTSNPLAETVYLFLGHITADRTTGGNDTFDVWIDPADLSNLGTADLSFSGDFVLPTAVIQDVHLDTEVGGTNPSRYTTFDELRIATSLNEVVPEPTTLALLGMGGLGVLLKRRR